MVPLHTKNCRLLFLKAAFVYNNVHINYYCNDSAPLGNLIVVYWARILKKYKVQCTLGLNPIFLHIILVKYFVVLDFSINT